MLEIQSLFSGKNKKTVSKCCLQIFLPSMRGIKRLSVFCFQILSMLAVGTYIGCYKFMSSMAGGGIDLNMESGMAE